MTQKTKSFILLPLVIAMMAAPLRMNAMDATSEGDEAISNENSEQDSGHAGTGLNSEAACRQAIQNQANRGATIRYTDDDSGETSLQSNPSSSEQTPNTTPSPHKDHLVQEAEPLLIKAQQAAASMRRERNHFQNRSISDEARSGITSEAELQRTAWQEINRCYNQFLKEAATRTISDTTRSCINKLIIASNEASQAAQELLDFLSLGETARLSSITTSEFCSYPSNTSHTEKLENKTPNNNEVITQKFFTKAEQTRRKKRSALKEELGATSADSIFLSNAVIRYARKEEALWTRATMACRQGLEEALNIHSKAIWQIDCEDAENKKTHWGTQVASYKTQQTQSAAHKIPVPIEKPVAAAVDGENRSEDFQTLPGGYLFPQCGGLFYNDRWYTEHALERMAPATPEIMKLLEARAIKRAQAEGLDFDPTTLELINSQPTAFKAWWSQHGPDPRTILPCEVETEIANPETTDLKVVTAETGEVITVIRRTKLAIKSFLEPKCDVVVKEKKKERVFKTQKVKVTKARARDISLLSIANELTDNPNNPTPPFAKIQLVRSFSNRSAAQLPETMPVAQLSYSELSLTNWVRRMQTILAKDKPSSAALRSFPSELETKKLIVLTKLKKTASDKLRSKSKKNKEAPPPKTQG